MQTTFTRSRPLEGLSNPVQLASKPRVSRGRERRLESGEEARLKEVAPPAFWGIIVFAIETAMRRTEIAEVEWRYVDLTEGDESVFLPDTKNNTARTVPLSPAALDVLLALPHRTGLVFKTSPQMITRQMMEVTRLAGIEDLHFHDLRHEATSRFFEDTDWRDVEIMRVTGHKTLAMLDRYAHLRTKGMAKELAKARPRKE